MSSTILTQLHLLLVSNANDDSDFSVHGINLSNSRLQGSSSCALSVTVTQLCLIYKLQRIVTLSAFFYICPFVFVILLFNVTVTLVFYIHVVSL